MKAGVIISGSGATLILTACASFEDPELVNALLNKGINKYITFEVPLDLVKDRYGNHYSVVMTDRKQKDVLRVVDVDGHRIFRQFPLDAFSRPICHEQPMIRHKAA